MEAKKLRIVFMGTPDFAVASLRELVVNGYNVVGVVTMPDKPSGRGLKMNESAVKKYALEAGLKVLQPEKLKDPAFIEELRALQPDLGIVIAFRMLPEIVWSMPRLGTFNLHASLLPQYRGAAPINRAIMNGETVTGVTTFFLNSEIDKGGIIGSREVPVCTDDTAGTLHDKLMNTGSELVLETVERIASGDLAPITQPENSSLKAAPKIFKEDCLIRWDRKPEEIYNFVRGLSPYPAAWSYLTDKTAPCVVKTVNEQGELMERDCGQTLIPQPVTIKILAVRASEEPHSEQYGAIVTDGKSFLKVACHGGWIFVDELQPAGKKRMKTEEFLRGFRNPDRYSF